MRAEWEGPEDARRREELAATHRLTGYIFLGIFVAYTAAWVWLGVAR